jgi:hypothetical protein
VGIPQDRFEILPGFRAGRHHRVQHGDVVKINEDLPQIKQNRLDLHYEILTCGGLASVNQNVNTSDMAIRNPNEYTSRRERRQAAPESTFKEIEYIERLSKNRTPVVVKLIDDEEVRGWIEYYDRDIIRITRDNGPNLFIYKNRVKYIYEDPASGNGRSR